MNLNDTDGDGVRDNQDGDGVAGEMDLVKLELHKPDGLTVGQVVVLDFPEDFLALWWNADRTGAITQDASEPFGERHFEIFDFIDGNGTVTLYVEVVGTPASYQLVMSYGGQRDYAKVTGIWATVTAVEYNTRDVAVVLDDPLWSDLPDEGVSDSPRGYLTAFGGTGLRPTIASGPNQGIRNVILIQFTLAPWPIPNSVDIDFGITRRKARRGWVLDANKQIIATAPPIDFPSDPNLPNDDGLGDTDESEGPNVNGVMFVIDGPGQLNPVPGPGREYFILRNNFEEFLRIKIGGSFNNPAGNVNAGSRASDKYVWHSQLYLENQNNLWQRDSAEDNTIGPGHIVLGDTP